MAARRTFTNEFKVQVVREYLGGVASRVWVARRYEITAEQLRV